MVFDSRKDSLIILFGIVSHHLSEKIVSILGRTGQKNSGLFSVVRDVKSVTDGKDLIHVEG